jgi:hypothetical protein
MEEPTAATGPWFKIINDLYIKVFQYKLSRFCGTFYIYCQYGLLWMGFSPLAPILTGYAFPSEIAFLERLMTN